MPVTETAEEMQVAKSKKVIALTKGVAIVTVVISLLTTSFATVAILINQDKAANRILDCVVPTGGCYKSKIAGAQASSNAEITIIVNYCLDETNKDRDATRACVQRELDRR